MSAGVWVAFFAVLYGCGIPFWGVRIMRDANEMIATGQIRGVSRRGFKVIVSLFALGWPALALYWAAVKIISAYADARGIDLNRDDDDEPPDAPNGAT